MTTLLLAENDQARLLFLGNFLQDLGDSERLDRAFRLHQDAAVGAHGEPGADRLRRLRRTDGDDHSTATSALIVVFITSSVAASRRFQRGI